MGRIYAGKVSDIPAGGMIRIEAGGSAILIANVDGTYHAVDDTCTHAGASLAEGKLDGHAVTCGWHGAQFDCRGGALLKFPAKIRDLGTYRITVEDGDLFVEL